jgi:predicted nuclease of predicted toxin-antitoxin system
MRLLFDENLSPKLPHLLASVFPGSTHVQDCGLQGQPDSAIWEYAATNGFTIISKDSDFYVLSIFANPPPKVIWLRAGNCSRNLVLDLLRKHESTILSLETGPESVLILS